MRITEHKSLPDRGVPLERWMAMRRRRRMIFFMAVMAGLATLIGIQIVKHRERYETALRVLGKAEAVEDGRTLLFRPEGAARPISLRLLGISPADASRESAAQQWLAEHAVGQDVTVSFDRRARRHDEASRLRGYVFLADGRMLNEQLLTRGLGVAEMSEGYGLRPWFAKLQGRAKSIPGAMAPKTASAEGR